MSQLFKNLKSIFVVEGEDAPKKRGKASVEADDAAPAEEVNPKMEIDAEVLEGAVNPKFTDILLKAIEANNQEGFDYLEFKRSLQNLSKMNMSEETTFKSAYAAAQTMGATPDGLINSADRYLQVLKKEEEKFAAALANQRAKQIDGRMTEMQQMQEGVRQKEARIKDLEVEIAADKGKLTQAEATIRAATTKVEATGKNFQASYGNLIKQIREDMSNIKKHLG